MTELIFQKENIGLGKRKQAVARVFLIPGEGNLTINQGSGNKYLQYNDTYRPKKLPTLKNVQGKAEMKVLKAWRPHECQLQLQ